MKEQGLVCYLSVILYIYENWGKTAPFSTFFHPLQSMFASQNKRRRLCGSIGRFKD